MRNLIEHPITIKEALSHLEDMIMRETDDDAVGGVNGLILNKIYEFVEENMRDEDFV